MVDALDRNRFLHRLSSLQSLCRDKQEISSLLFICGQDGRNNKGSMSVLKYLFRGAIGKDLFESDMLSISDEVLEDLVFLVSEDSLSVIWSHEMKRLLSPLINYVPNLIEYISSSQDETDIDLLQARKCCEFKRMTLQTVKKNGSIGMTVPIGYEDTQEIENWPLLQSFAIDSVYSATGFFTTNYSIVDISENMDVLFRTLDGYYIDNTISLLQKTVHPHMLQSLQILYPNNNSLEHRNRITSEDIISPLELLYEFGEMESVHGHSDPITKPTLFFDSDSIEFGAGVVSSSIKKKVLGNNIYCLIEGCEPSAGLRWCRTYFLQRGKSHTLLSEVDSLLTSEFVAAEDGGEGSAPVVYLKTTTDAVSSDVTASVKRAEAIYIKLWLTLRFVVRIAFAIHSDVLEAGTYIQQKLTAIMSGEGENEEEQDADLEILYESCKVLGLKKLTLLASEELQVHMDCMNAIGEIVSIEDVDEMGGSCLTYIRVSVHGVSLRYSGKKTLGVVAVGDTFVFSSQIIKGEIVIVDSTRQKQLKSKLLLPLLQDYVCLTHSLPYYRCMNGVGVEEKASSRLLSCAKSTHYIAHLGLGKQLDYSGVGLLSVPILTDHPIIPVSEAEIRVFSEGILIEKTDIIRMPFIISFQTHVELVWIVDLADCSTLASNLLPQAPSAVVHKNLKLSGLLILFRLKTEYDDCDAHLLPYNPLEKVLPFVESVESVRHLGLVMKTGARSANAMSIAMNSWHNSLRANGVQVHRGAADISIPESILKAYLSAVDCWIDDEIADSDITDDKLVLSAKYFSQNPLNQFPTDGLFSLRSIFSLSESQKLSSFDYNDNLIEAKEIKKRITTNKNKILLCIGHSGIGTNLIVSSLFTQLSQKLSNTSISISQLVVDIADLYCRYERQNGKEDLSIDILFKDFIESFINSRKQTQVVMITIVFSPVVIINHLHLLNFLINSFNAEISLTISITCTSWLLKSNDLTDSSSGWTKKIDTETKYGLGYEQCTSSFASILHPFVCDSIIVIDESSSKSSGESEYGRLRTLLSNINSEASLIRLKSGLLRLDDDSIELFANILFLLDQKSSNKMFDVSLTNSGACRQAMGYPSNFTLQHTANNLVHSAAIAKINNISNINGYRSYRVIQFTPSSLKISQWSLYGLTKTLQLLFPFANLSSVSAYDNEDAWVVSKSKNGKKFFHRAIELATAKVMTKQQSSKGKKSFDKCLLQNQSKFGKRIDDLVVNIYSVSGLIRPPFHLNNVQYNQTSIQLESTFGSIIIRDAPSRNKGDDVITIEGVFDSSDITLLENLFSSCEFYKLPMKEHLTISDVSYNEKLMIQSNPTLVNKYIKKRILPSGWWYDGNNYIDISGNQLPVRPDMDIILEEYIQDENIKIDYYNSLVDSINF